MATNDLTRYAENEKQRPLLALLSRPEQVTRFEQAAGAKAGAVIINIINAANANPEIWECEPQTVVTAALNAATIGLSLAPGLGQAAILPFRKNTKVGDKWETTKRAQLVIMVRGVKDLAMRTNKYRTLNDFRLYEGQEIVEDQMTGRKTIKGKRTNDNVIGYGAYMQLFSGYEHTVYWPKEKVIAHAQEYSPTFNKKENKFSSGSRWVTKFDEQAAKTVIKDLIMNHGTISENDRALLKTIDDEREPGFELPFTEEPEVVDGEMKDAAPEEKRERPTQAENLAALGFGDEPKQAPAPAAPIDYRAEFSATWNKAGKAKLLTPENVEVWKIGPTSTDEEIAGKIALIEAALATVEQ